MEDVPPPDIDHTDDAVPGEELYKTTRVYCADCEFERTVAEPADDLDRWAKTAFAHAMNTNHNWQIETEYHEGQ